MRLICPNCGAQYQVDDDVIPEAGRDVQCSNCGHTWFERPGASEAAEEGFDALETPAPPPPPAPDYVDSATPAPPEVAAEAPEPPAPAPAEVYDDDEDGAPEAPPAPPRRQALDSSVTDILREEAAREQAARAAETPPTPLESQSDLGIDAAATVADQRDEEARARMARMKGEENAAAVAAMTAASRKEILPDIEEINSTLRSSAERGESHPPMPEEVVASDKRGFRFGFFGGLLIIVLLVALYVFADAIAAAVPAVEGIMTSYVSMVDQARLWLDAQVSGLLDRIDPPAQDGDS